MKEQTMTYQDLSNAFQALAKALMGAFEALVTTLTPFSNALVIRFAIERMGLTEVDIRRVHGYKVTTWNRMTYQVDPEAFKEWIKS